jgi:DNA processing protein
MTASVWRLPRGAEGYPAPLQDLDEPPAVLHGIGDARLVSGIGRNTAVTIVGSRHPSSYGLEVAEELGYLLAGAGLVVVSGMALGIDAAAHRGRSRRRSCDRRPRQRTGVVYPRSEAQAVRADHLGGRRRLEMPPGTVGPAASQPTGSWRARTMTVVVEAAQPSGSLITAEQAARLAGRWARCRAG